MYFLYRREEKTVRTKQNERIHWCWFESRFFSHRQFSSCPCVNLYIVYLYMCVSVYMGVCVNMYFLFNFLFILLKSREYVEKAIFKKYIQHNSMKFHCEWLICRYWISCKALTFSRSPFLPVFFFFFSRAYTHFSFLCSSLAWANGWKSIYRLESMEFRVYIAINGRFKLCFRRWWVLYIIYTYRMCDRHEWWWKSKKMRYEKTVEGMFYISVSMSFGQIFYMSIRKSL